MGNLGLLNGLGRQPQNLTDEAGNIIAGEMAVATGLSTVAVGPNASSTASSAVAVGGSAVASATQAVAVGKNARAITSAEAIAIGGGTNTTAGPLANAQGAIAIGASDGSAVNGARASGTSCIAIGSGTASTAGASATGTSGIAIGGGAAANAVNNVVAIGSSSSVSQSSSVAIGSSSAASGSRTTALGFQATAGSGVESVAVGANAQATTANQTIAIGGGTNTTAAPLASAQGAIAIGASNGSAVNGARAAGASAIAIGCGDASVAGASASAADTIAIGRTAAAAHATAVAIGKGATTTAANQIMLGTATEQVVVPGTLSILSGPGRSAGRTTNVTIANTETSIISLSVAANTLAVGSTFRLKVMGLWTNTTAAATSVLRVRFGTSSLSGNIAAGISVDGGTTARTNIPFVFDAMVTVLSIGGSGTVLGAVFPSIGNVVAPVLSAPVTTAVALDTTATKLVELTYISGATTTSINVLSATIVQEI